MNKRTFLLLFLTLRGLYVFSNKIDSLRTDKDVKKFLKNNFEVVCEGSIGESYFASEEKKAVKKLEIKNWLKFDIDFNGETDLLIMNSGSCYPHFYVVLSNNNSLKLIRPKYNYREMSQFRYAKFQIIDSVPAFVLFSHDKEFNYDSKKWVYHSPVPIDTIVLKDELFLNFNKYPSEQHIESIEFYNNGLCEGDCPQILISINLEKKINVCTMTYRSDTSVVYKSSIPDIEVAKIIELLNYSNCSLLKSEYVTGTTDLTTTSLKIIYNGGKVKSIEDNGASGTFTLVEIYSIAFNRHWTKE